MDRVGAVDAAGQVVGFAANALTVLVSVVAIAAVIGALTGRSRLVPMILRRARAGTVGQALVSLGVPKTEVRRGVREVLADRLAGRRPWTLPDEMSWLDQVFGPGQAPVTFCGAGVGPTGHPETDDPKARAALLTVLAEAYALLGGRLESRALIAADQVTALRQEAHLAAHLARALAEYAAFTATAVGEAAFRVVVQRHDLVLELLEPPQAYPTPWPERVALSHRRRRVVPALPSALQRAQADGVEPEVLETSGQERERLAEKLTGRRFDGVLPSLVGCRFERDAGSGRGRLHLATQECTFSSVMLAAYGGPDGVGRSWSGTTQDGPSPHLLTLSLMLVTSDEKLVAVRRPPSMQMAERWVPSVNGNLEVGPRFGIQEDVDEQGRLDLVAAVVRETREELGLVIDPHRVRCTGLVRFFSHGEWNTNVLCFIAPAGMTAEALRDAAVDADPVEGAYEVGDSLLLLPWSNPGSDAARLAEWAATAPDVAPHLAACLITVARAHPGDLPGPWTGPTAPPTLPAGAEFIATRP